MLLTAMFVATVLAACGSDSDSDSDKKDDDQEQAENQDDQDISISDDEKVPGDDVVAQVNDKKIKGKQYNDIYAQTKSAMKMNGEDVEDKDAMKDQALDVLVQQELIQQDADDKGINVSDDEVDKEFDKMKEDEDQFKAALEQLKLSEKGYRNQLAFEMTVDKYMDKEFPDTEVSDDDAKEQYDQLKEQSGDNDVPEFDDIKDDIKEQMEQEKQGEKLQDKAEKLEDKADVKNMI